ncbi:hypothetical protein B0H12DRAFT_1098840 [Mycena haematopus]|nr:hypothetical protein B0H12DRAFT_1098840 [Mycena haematopus]
MSSRCHSASIPPEPLLRLTSRLRRSLPRLEGTFNFAFRFDLFLPCMPRLPNNKTVRAPSPDPHLSRLGYGMCGAATAINCGQEAFRTHL